MNVELALKALLQLVVNKKTKKMPRRYRVINEFVKLIK
jgi:hypothetical protein